MFATAATARDFVLALSPWIPGQNSYASGSITKEELTRALASKVPAAQIETLELQHDSRGTTDRARLRLTWNEAGRAARLPPSVFAKGTPSQLVPRLVVSTFGLHTYETRFFEQVYPAVTDLTITPYVTRAGVGGRYVIAFEDLTLRPGLRFYDADEDAPLSHVQALVDLLAKLHGRFWKSPRFASDLNWIATNSQRPGSAIAKRLAGWSEKRFMKQDREVPAPVRRLTRIYVENQAQLVRVWEALPQTLCHGDCHLGNTYADGDGTAGIFDWQVFHKMNGLRDFAYFMTHSVPTELRRAEERNLLARYLAGLAEAGAGKEAPTFGAAFDTYRLLTVDGWIAVMFTRSAGSMQPDDRMEVTALRAMNTLVDLEVDRVLEAHL